MEWQPIDTAPKDGTRILVVGADGYVTIAHWQETVWLDDSFDCPDCPETHWMPLPGTKALFNPYRGPDLSAEEWRRLNEPCLSGFHP